MTLQYPQLTYPGDVTGSPQAAPGHLLGCDEVGRFYEVIDAEFCPAGQNYVNGTGKTFPGCPEHGRVTAHTTVNLQYATAESLQRAATGREA
jgi:hypothetical protein